jgi:hypothetical protein
VYPELVQYVEGKPKTVLYQQLPAIMLNELQKQHRQIQELTERLAQLEQALIGPSGEFPAKAVKPLEVDDDR